MALSSVRHPHSFNVPEFEHNPKRKLFGGSLRDEPAVKKSKIGGFIPRNLSSTAKQDFIESVIDPSDESVHELSGNEHDFTHHQIVDSAKRLSNASRAGSPNSELGLSDLARTAATKGVHIATHTGRIVHLTRRQRKPLQTYESLISERSTTREGQARRAYYGVSIHKLIDEAKIQQELDQAAREVEAQRSQEARPSVESPLAGHAHRPSHQLWTEKYRARKFTELVGDERTHRQVLKWLKGWDRIVFPSAIKSRPKPDADNRDNTDEHQHRKVLLLTGPPGLGKTTLAHVCAKQAGYEVLEINASDDRSREVVKGRIRDALGTETVRGIKETGQSRRAGRPACVIVDEVDGVVTGTGSAGGEGGFMKALIDLVQLDQKNSSDMADNSHTKKKKGDRFRLLRPLILICNDVYAPSLRPLRTSGIAEIVYVRKPSLEKVVSRLKTVFEKEQILCDNDAVRRLCESAWGLEARKQNTMGARAAGEGDIRGVLVQGEWMASKIRSLAISEPDAEKRLTRKWVDATLRESNGQRGLGRGETREIVDRVFLEGAGVANLPTTFSADEQRQISEAKSSLGVADLKKRAAIHALNEMISTHGNHDQILTECLATYPARVFQDDTFLSKPNNAYDWLHFHDQISGKVHSHQEWELMPYLPTSACAFHDLFASIDRGVTSWTTQNIDGKPDNDSGEGADDSHPFASPRADYSAKEAEKMHRSTLTELQANFSGELLRMFSSIDVVSTELVPQLTRMIAPDIKPVLVGGSNSSSGGPGSAIASIRKDTERRCATASARIMHAVSITLERVRVESEGYGNGSTAYRLEPPIDELGAFHMSTKGHHHQQPTRYAVRQVLDQELRKCKAIEAQRIRLARSSGPNTSSIHDSASTTAASELNAETQPENAQDAANPVKKLKKDFFGRIIADTNLNRGPDAASTNNPTTSKNQAYSSSGSGKLPSSSASTSKVPTPATRINNPQGRIWVNFNEGFSNAVRKPITLKELLDGF